MHIPFLAAHDVENGNDDVSISLSIIFNTAQTDQLKKAMHFNHLVRTKLPLGDKFIHKIQPTRTSYTTKAKIYTLYKEIAARRKD